MFQKILVPLDGSKLAECALPYTEELAKGCKTDEVVLVSVTEQLKGETAAPEYQELYHSSDIEGFAGAKTLDPLSYNQNPLVADPFRDTGNLNEMESAIRIMLGKKTTQAQKYLSRLVKALGDKGIKARAEVLIGNPAEEITSCAKNNDINVIVMSSHGRSGPSRWVFGSVADKVFRASCVPVLMVRAPGCVTGI